MKFLCLWASRNGGVRVSLICSQKSQSWIQIFHFLGRTVAISGSRQRDRPFRLASSRVPLHRVVLGEPSIRSGHPLPEVVNLPGRWGRMPTRIARRLTRQRQWTRVMTDLHRAAQPTRLATGASTQLQLLSGLNPGSPSRYQPGPATLPPSRSQSSAELRLPDRGREEIGSLRRGERTRRTGKLISGGPPIIHSAGFYPPSDPATG